MEKVHTLSAQSLRGFPGVGIQINGPSVGLIAERWYLLVPSSRLAELFLVLYTRLSSRRLRGGGDSLALCPQEHLKLLNTSDFRQKSCVVVDLPASLPARSIPLTPVCPGQVTLQYIG